MISAKDSQREYYLLNPLLNCQTLGNEALRFLNGGAVPSAAGAQILG